MATTPPEKSRLKAWLSLLAGTASLLVFLFVILPAGQRIPQFKQMADSIEAKGIEATAIYYSEVEACYDAEMNIRHTVFFPPVGPNGTPKWDSGTP